MAHDAAAQIIDALCRAVAQISLCRARERVADGPFVRRTAQ
jgi:hypothetical protein